MPLEYFPIWRRPRHYMDVEGARDHVHWVELFFDLIQVVTVFLLGNYLSRHLDWHGSGSSPASSWPSFSPGPTARSITPSTSRLTCRTAWSWLSRS